MAGNEEYKIYVGRLPWETLEHELEEAFSRFGKILLTKILRERDTGDSRGFGFITFESRQGMNNAIREMNGEKFGDRIIIVAKAKFREEGEDAEPGFNEGYLSGGQDSQKRRGRSMVRGRCYNCGNLGHWVRECPLIGRARSPLSSHSCFERDGSDDCLGRDHDLYVDEQYDGGQDQEVDRLDSKDDKDNSRNVHCSIRMSLTGGNSNTNNSCCHLVDCKVGNVAATASNLTDIMQKHVEIDNNNSNSVGDPQKITLVKNEEEKEDSKASLVAINFSQEDAGKVLSTMGLLDELPFSLLESERFHKFCKLMQPKFVIPSRVTMAKDWFQIYLSNRKCLENVLTQNHQGVCLAANTWTSDYDVEYMVLTAHFIDNDWNLHKRILNFCQISNKEGETVGKTMEKCLLEWNIKRVITITVDNACSDVGAIGYLSTKLIAQNALLIPREFLHVRCCSDILRLIVNDASKDLHESIEKIRNKLKQSSMGLRLQAYSDSNEENETEDLSYLGIPGISLSKPVLKIFLNLQKAFEDIKDQNPGPFFFGTPSLEDWENFRAFIKLLTVLSDVTSKFSRSLCVTSNEYFHELCSIQDLFREYSQTNNMYLGRMIQNVQAKFNHYWGSTEETNFLLYVAVVLDPRYKLKFVKYCFEEFWEKNVAKKMTKKVERTLRNMCDEYFFIMPREESNDGINQSNQCTDIEMSAQSGSACASMAEKFRKCLDKEVSNDCKMDLENYLYEPCYRSEDDNFDVLKWWKLNSTRFKILSQIAKDVLAIPISTTTSFSIEACVLDRFHDSCPPKMIEAIICAQNWLRSKSFIADEGDGIEDIDILDKEFSYIALEMDLDSISD